MRDKVRIETYDADRVENPSPNGEVDQAQWMKIRNTLVAVCRRHGPTGPMGTFSFTRLHHTGDFLKAWEIGDDDCIYYIIPDQYNGIDRYHYIELTATDALTKEWLCDVMDALLTFRGWGLGVSNINSGYMLIFSDKIMVTGTAAAAVDSVESMISVVRQHLIT